MARQETLAQACDRLVAMGSAERVFGSAIRLLPPKTAAERQEIGRRFDTLDRIYGEEVARRGEEGDRERHEAERRNRDFVFRPQI